MSGLKPFSDATSINPVRLGVTGLEQNQVFTRTLALTLEKSNGLLLLELDRNQIGESTIHGAVNAIKFYYEQVLQKPKVHYNLPRPKKPVKNVTVFSENEVVKVFDAVSNIKHKAIMMLAYATGLRVSEITGLEIPEIDTERMVIHVRSGKVQPVGFKIRQREDLVI